jgi:hypothetical protein
MSVMSRITSQNYARKLTLEGTMSVDVKDFRKFVAAAAEKANAANAPVHIPIEQVESPDATTGDEHMDKLVRAIQSIIESLEPRLTGPESLPIKAMGAPNYDMVVMCSKEYWYQKGKQDTLKEVIKLPAQIIMESKMK